MRRIITTSFRRFSSEGTAEKVITKETKAKDGTSIIEKINIIQKWSKMSNTQKILLATYGTCVSASFFLATYHDGRDELVAMREQRNKSTAVIDATVRAEQDWKSVRNGCSKRMGSNFFDSVFFPFVWTVNVVPKVVLFFNPEKKN